MYVFGSCTHVRAPSRVQELAVGDTSITQPLCPLQSALREIVRMDGPRALWRGVTPTLMMSVPATGLYFSLYDALKKRITTLIPNTSPLSQSLVPLYAGICPSCKQSLLVSLYMCLCVLDDAPCLAGASARLLAATITLPFEVLKTNMQARSGKIGEERSVLPAVRLGVLRKAVACRVAGVS